MAAWFGFSDDDLRKVKNMTKSNNDQSQIKREDQQKKVPQARKIQHRPATSPAAQTSPAEIDPAMRLQRPPGKQATDGHKIPKERKEMGPVKEASVEKEGKNITNEPEVVKKSLDDKEGFDRDLMSLEKFREQQKAIEEANKQKKALLSKTITERKKKAVAEAHKLEHIQKELSKLDQLLTCDVQVIRNKIEDISRDYMEAEKRFKRAEAEYIEAKIDMHEKSEQKESLTEHMYTIIHQNEVRKARRLAELMHEMEMESGGEDVDLQLPDLPPLSSFQQTSLSPTGIKHILKLQHSVEGGDKPSEAIGANAVTGNASDTNVVAGSSKGSDIDGGKEVGKECTGGGNGPASNEAKTTVSVEKQVTTGETVSENSQGIKSESVQNGPATATAENRSDESEGKTPVTAEGCESVDSDSAADVSRVKQEPVEVSANQFQVDDTAVNVAQVKSEPKVPSKWDFDGTVP